MSKPHFQVSPWASSKWSHTDIPRLVKGKVGAQLWVAYSPCGSQHKDAVQITLEQIDLIKRLMADYSNHLQLVTTANGEKLKLSNGSKFPQNCRSGHRPPVWEDCRGGDSGVRPLHRHLSLRAQDVSSARSEVTRPHSQLQQPMVGTRILNFNFLLNILLAKSKILDTSTLNRFSKGALHIL